MSAAEIPNARFEVMPGGAHQPFQEVPDEFNARVDAVWRDVDASVQAAVEDYYQQREAAVEQALASGDMPSFD